MSDSRGGLNCLTARERLNGLAARLCTASDHLYDRKGSNVGIKLSDIKGGVKLCDGKGAV